MSSGFIGALIAGSLLIRDRLPTYVLDPSDKQAGSPADGMWLRPRLVVPQSLPSLCSFIEEPQGLRSLRLPYTRSSTGTVHLTLSITPPGGRLVLILGTALPPCGGIAWLGSMLGSRESLFSGLMQLMGWQVLRLP